MKIQKLSPRNHGFTLIELLVVIGIIGILMGLLLAGVQKVREAGQYISCGNNLRQFGVAIHNMQDTHKKLAPGLGWFSGQGPPGAYGTIHFHLLPFIEQGNLYQHSYYSGCYFAGNNQVYSQPVVLFQCPADPSVPGNGAALDNLGYNWGVASYAANVQVFTKTWPNGVMIDAQYGANIPASIHDGTSNTILFSEKYAQCFNADYPYGGNFWAYYFTGQGLNPYHPGFEISWNGYSIGPGSKFQIQPHPYNGKCDPTLASSPHGAGIHASFADGSVRFLSSGISNYTWWYLCTPRGGELILSDGY